MQPGLLPALVVFLVYVGLTFGLQRLIGGNVDYTEIADRALRRNNPGNEIERLMSTGTPQAA